MNQKYFPFNMKIGIQNPCGKIKANCFFLLLENETTFLSLGKRKVHQVTFMLNNVEKLSTFVLENEMCWEYSGKLLRFMLNVEIVLSCEMVSERHYTFSTFPFFHF